MSFIGGVGSRLWWAALVTGLLAAGALARAEPAGGSPAWITAWAQLLERHTRAVDAVVGTRVDYRALLGDPTWREMLDGLGRVDPSELRSREERLAFWINVYNILAIDVVLRSYPVESIRDAGSFFRPVWRIEAGRIGGRAYTLHEIEHEILRPMGEARIHAAIVCASISCPNLLREPYEADRLDAQLSASSRAWLARPEKGVRLDRARRVLRLSPIFDWFEEDFGGEAGVVDFVEEYAPEEVAAWLRANPGELGLEYFDYDWRLNE